MTLRVAARLIQQNAVCGTDLIAPAFLPTFLSRVAFSADASPEQLETQISSFEDGLGPSTQASTHALPNLQSPRQATFPQLGQHPLQRPVSNLPPATSHAQPHLLPHHQYLPNLQHALPSRIILMRHAQSEDLDELQAARVPDHLIPLTAKGEQDAKDCGAVLHTMLMALNPNYRLQVYCAPYRRTKQTTLLALSSLERLGLGRVLGVQEEVQLREQEFGSNIGSIDELRRLKEERIRYSRFFYRFPSGESGADVYNRMAAFQDRLLRDMCEGVFDSNTTVLLVTHGIAMRIFLMRWLHWTVEQWSQVYNPRAAAPVVLERVMQPQAGLMAGPHNSRALEHIRGLYELQEEAKLLLPGVDDRMLLTAKRNI